MGAIKSHPVTSPLVLGNVILSWMKNRDIWCLMADSIVLFWGNFR